MSKVNTEIKYKNAQIPKKPLVSFLLMFKFFPLFPFAKFLINSKLRSCKNLKYEPGFRYFYGNIVADNVYVSDTFFIDYAQVTIGSGTVFSRENIVITGTHDLYNRSTIIAKPVSIGENCWITTRCIILPGTTIGNNCVLGAGSVVSGDIPDNSLVMGNPGKVVKTLKYPGDANMSFYENVIS